jgi:hypothetical protein
VFIAIIYFIPSGQSYVGSKRAQIIEGENEWILQCDIINDEERDIKYTIVVTVDDAVYRDSTVVQPGKTYTFNVDDIIDVQSETRLLNGLP